MTLSNKNAVVVGGGTGIGAGVAVALHQAGANVLVAGRREEPLKKLAEEHEVHVGHVDVADLDAVRNFIVRTEERLGRIDVLVNSAGINVSPRTLMGVSPDDWNRLMRINATGCFNLFHCALPSMIERGDGLVVQITSIAGLRAMELAGAGYCASKFAASSLGTYAGLELADTGVRVTNIYPGEVETPILENRPEPVSAERRAKMLQPEDVGAAVVMVAQLPPRAHVPDLVIKPAVQKFA